MYVGVDFLWNGKDRFHVSEVNTGLPAGATEYDLVYRRKFRRPSGIFEKIRSLSLETFHLDFPAYVSRLPWLNDLRQLKIWMDGQGPPPRNPHPFVRLEDKWIQYGILKEDFPAIPTVLLPSPPHLSVAPASWNPVVLKRRMGRGGRGLRLVNREENIHDLSLPESHFILQPMIASQVEKWSFSIRAAAFAGHFLCLFASLAERKFSNHGVRFFVSPGRELRLSNPSFDGKIFHQKSWEADLFYQGNIPHYLHRDIHREEIADADLIIPEKGYAAIRKAAAAISALYMRIDPGRLPRSLIENMAE
jgi:hypothetical protein